MAGRYHYADPEPATADAQSDSGPSPLALQSADQTESTATLPMSARFPIDSFFLAPPGK